MPKLALAETALHYEDEGSGDAILCIPGALGTGAGDFHEQLPVFSKSYRVIAPDPRGYGQSRPPARDYPLDFYQRDAGDMIALTTALGIDKFRIMGWSDGANAGALLAVKYPERVQQLVVWGGNSFISEQEIEKFRSMRSISTWAQRAVDSMTPVYGDDLGAMWAAYVDGVDRIYQNGGDLYRSQLPLIECPALILHGAKDPLVPSFQAATLRDGIKGSELFTFPEGKHNIHVKYATIFNRIVAGFFDRQG
jgi:valacyclovir hydrolase